MKTLTNQDPDTLRTAVRERYAAIAGASGPQQATTGCCSSPATPDSGCCSTPATPASSCGGAATAADQAITLGYAAGDLAGIPAGANLGLGCGNPVALASLEPGLTVLDLGAGAGFDAFLAARAVGPNGRVIGVDMTPEMVTKARANAARGGFTQVDFRLGEIEALPVADAVVDVIISNCVINLCPDKRPVYREAFRVLKPGGRLAVSDVVARGPLAPEVANDLALYSGCLAGATPVAELLEILAEAGFADIKVQPKGNTDEIITSWDASRSLEQQVFAAEVTAIKPAAAD